MKPITAIALTVLLVGCGPDKELIMDTKFDAPLRRRIAALTTSEQTETLTILGKCVSTIDGIMRQQLLDAGASVETMAGDVFTAHVSSDDIFDVAALEFVTQLQLSGKSRLLERQ